MSSFWISKNKHNARYHPDKLHDEAVGVSSQRFRDIVAAYETLRDPVKRSAYHLSLRSAISHLPPTQDIDLDDMAFTPASCRCDAWRKKTDEFGNTIKHEVVMSASSSPTRLMGKVTL